MEQKGLSKTVVIGSIICSLILLGVLGSYAYFMGNLGSNKQEEVNVQTGNLALTFADGTSSFQGKLDFGGSATKDFTIENTGSLDVTARVMWNDLVNTYTKGSLTYGLAYSETEGGPYTEVVVDNQNVPVSSSSTKELLAGNLVIPKEKKYYYQLTITLNYLESTDQTADLKAMLSTNFTIEESDGKDVLNAVEITLAKINKTTKTSEKVNFAIAAVTDETIDGLYSMADDYGMSYYYRGAVEDNYVKFGKWSETSSQTDKRGKPMYWRIIRVNGDGSVRMIYDGTQRHTKNDTSEDRLAWSNQAFNLVNNDAKYVGYMYSPSGSEASTSKKQAQTNEISSDIKTKLEDWYAENLASEDANIADSLFCYDRTTPGSEVTGWESDTGLGYGADRTGYGAYAREGYYVTQNEKIEPKLVCENKNDAFTKNNSEKGNGTLDQKIGLITADEMVIAGGLYGTKNQNFYLYKGSWYWTGSPGIFDSFARVFCVRHDLINQTVDSLGGVAPVISLTPEYFATLIGDGSAGNPFREKGMEP